MNSKTMNLSFKPTQLLRDRPLRDRPLRGRLSSWVIYTIALTCITTSCGQDQPSPVSDHNGSHHLLVFAGDQDNQDSDFLMVIDINPESKSPAKAISSVPIGHKNSMPHHMEYYTPPKGEPIFMNGHRDELTMIVDINDPETPKIVKKIAPPDPLRFPHDYTRTPNGNRLVGFLRSNGPSPDQSESITPGNHGGIAEYSVEGRLLRTTSAAVDDSLKPVRPYAFALLTDTDRFVTTSAPMMEKTWADVIQIYKYSTFELLHTIDLPVGRLPNGDIIEGSQAAGFGPRVLDDGSVFLNTYGCAFYHLTQIDTTAPKLEMVYAVDTKPAKNENTIRGACGIPLRIGHYWIQPIGHLQTILVLDIKNPSQPQEVTRFKTPKNFNPHWMAKDTLSNRLIVGAELGGEQGFFMLRFNETTGHIEYDQQFSAKRGRGLFAKNQKGYISLERNEWPHGKSGYAWGHAALFLP